MLKRMVISLLFMAVIMAAPQVSLADDNCGSKCIAPTCATSSCTADEKAAGTCACINGYDIRAVIKPGTVPNLILQTADFPYNDGTCSGDYCFKYTVSPPPSPSSCAMKSLEMLIPVCSSAVAENAINILASSPGTTTFAPGAGGPSTAFGKVVFQDYVVGFDATGAQSRGSFFIQANTSESAKTSMAIKLTSNSPGLQGGSILGPACYQPQLGTQSFKDIELVPGDPSTCMHFVFNPSGTVKSATFCNSEISVPQAELPSIMFNGQPLKFMPDGVVDTGEHSCTYYKIGTRLYGPVATGGSICK